MRTGALGVSQMLPTLMETKHVPLKKGILQETGILKEDQLMMETMLNDTDLNTPDIKFEGFDFLSGKSTSSYSKHNVITEGSQATMKSLVSAVHGLDENNLFLEAHEPSAAYASFDFSLDNTQDLFQAVRPSSQVHMYADQHDQRTSNKEECLVPFETENVNNSFAINHDISEVNDVPEDPNMFEDFVLTSHTERHVPYNSPPQISIDEENFDFDIPKDVLEMMESLFPEEKPIDSSFVKCNNVCTTELDMHLGQEEFDMDSPSLVLEQEQPGLFDELESFALEDTVSINSQPRTPLHNQVSTNNKDSQSRTLNLKQFNIVPEVYESNKFIQFGPSSSDTSSSMIFQFQTPFTLNSPSTGTVPKTPTKKHKIQEIRTPSSHPAKRIRRELRKPLRFTEHYTLEEFKDSDLEMTECTTQTQSRLDFDTSAEDIKSLNEADSIIISNGKRTLSPVKGLTEEQKYHRIRILNNEASKRCRLKRKVTMKEIEAQLGELEQKNLQLRGKKESLQKLKDKFQNFVSDFLRKQLSNNL